MPKLWDDTIDAHRAQVRNAVLDAAAELVFAQGLRSVTMAQIAERAGIGRATLYKYFPDVETILRTWHAQRIDTHIAELVRVRDGAGSPSARLQAVLTAYADIAHQTRSHDREVVTFLHPDDRIANAHKQLQNLVRHLIVEGVETGELRDDVDPDVLAAYCLNALAAAAELSGGVVPDLVAITIAGLRPA
ncbi:TetR family transcriptional regulator [Nocardia sp. 852002-20019_SCH5090214]|uniref:TetR/AcrR family transcriptional regulator n=1 Tax=Nocardia TaxID=1817 RepID=UPI0007A3F2C0|nr:MULTISPECIES: TetR/AcrR family transcriptional regulator [Nocardia]MCC3316739.1 TetR/AcrR family transcriptional regulator [Nocardia africana]OBA50939.1 TetR family transcriptional regulator [Nocardia sp. 852002-20019_SCH5090214]